MWLAPRDAFDAMSIVNTFGRLAESEARLQARCRALDFKISVLKPIFMVPKAINEARKDDDVVTVSCGMRG